MNTYRRTWRVLSVFVLLLAAIGIAAPGSGQAASNKPMPPSYSPFLCQVDSPNPSLTNVLNAVDVMTPIKGTPKPTFWAVGYTQDMGAPARSLTMRNEGEGWKVVPSPNLFGDNYLTAVAGRSPDNVWAVGYVAVNAGVEKPLVMHYDGRVWKLALYPDPTLDALPTGSAHLTGVTALSETEVVAVGYKFGHLVGTQPLVLYYNGSMWTEVEAPTMGAEGHLYAVAGTSVKDLWVTGRALPEAQSDLSSALYHFDGISWTTMARAAGELVSVEIASGSVFAVGTANVGKNKETLAIKYDMLKGFTDRVKTVNRDIDHNFLTSIVADGNAVYAVGYTGVPQNQTELQTLVMRYDGQTFVPLDSPNPTGVDRLLGATVWNGNLWAVGDSQLYFNDPGFIGLGSQTLIVTTECKD